MAKYIRDVGHSTPTFNVAVDDTPGILVQTGETLLFSYSILNNEAAVSYLQIFDAAALGDVTLGTTVADMVLATPASGAIQGALPMPVYFSLGLCIFCTTDSTGSTGASQDVGLAIA